MTKAALQQRIAEAKAAAAKPPGAEAKADAALRARAYEIIEGASNAEKRVVIPLAKAVEMAREEQEAGTPAAANVVRMPAPAPAPAPAPEPEPEN